MASVFDDELLLARVPVEDPDREKRYHQKHQPDEQIEALRVDLVARFNHAIATGVFPDARLMRAVVGVQAFVELYHNGPDVDPKTYENRGVSWKAFNALLPQLMARFPNEPLACALLGWWTSRESASKVEWLTNDIAPLLSGFLRRVAEGAATPDAADLLEALQGVYEFVTAQPGGKPMALRMALWPAFGPDVLLRLMLSPTWRDHSEVVSRIGGLLDKVSSDAGTAYIARAWEITAAARALPLSDLSTPIMVALRSLLDNRLPREESDLASLFDFLREWWTLHRDEVRTRSDEARLILIDFAANGGLAKGARSWPAFELMLDMADGINLDAPHAQEAALQVTSYMNDLCGRCPSEYVKPSQVRATLRNPAVLHHVLHVTRHPRHKLHARWAQRLLEVAFDDMKVGRGAKMGNGDEYLSYDEQK